MATDKNIFGAMLQEFDGAARLLGLDPGIWKILTHPKRQIIVSCPILMDSGQIEVFSARPRAASGITRTSRSTK